MNDLLSKMLDASGGLEHWKNTESVFFEGQMGGFMLTIKTAFNRKMYHQIIKRRNLEVFVHQQKMIFYDWPTPGFKGIYNSGDVRIESATGEIILERKNAKAYFFKNNGLSKSLAWDILDFTYFIGYGFWNYFTAPHIFTFEGVVCQEIKPVVHQNGEKYRVLQVNFPDYIHTHCRHQQYFIDKNGRIVQNNYELKIGGLFQFHFHNFVTKYENVEGLQLPVHRRIFFHWDTFFREKRKTKTASLPIWGTVHKATLKEKQ